MVKLAYDSKMKNPKGPCVVVIHANWCGHCKTLIPKFENDIVTSDQFSKELEGCFRWDLLKKPTMIPTPQKKYSGMSTVIPPFDTFILIKTENQQSRLTYRQIYLVNL